MKFKFCIFYFFLFKSILVFGQAPEIEWEKSYGGTSIDEAYSIYQTSDSGYVMAGLTHSDDGDITFHYGLSTDYWIVKVNKFGIIEWQKSFGGYEWDYAKFVEQTNDNGYIIAGWTYSIDGEVSDNHGQCDYWILKLSDSGFIEWKKSYGGSNVEDGWSIHQTSDGGFIVAGDAHSVDGDLTENFGGGDVWILKLNEDGDIEWQKSYGGSNFDYAWSLALTSDDGYVIGGMSSSSDGDLTINNGDNDYWILKLSSDGSIEWQKSYGGSGEDRANSIQQTFDGGYIVAGWTISNDGDVSGNHGNYDFWVLKLNAEGGLEWQKCYGGSQIDAASSVHQTIDGGYIVAGGSISIDGDVTGNHGDHDFWVVKLSPTGSLEWERSLGSSGFDGAIDINQTYDTGYIVAGYASSNTGDVSGNHGTMDYWIVKLKPDCIVTGVEDICNASDDNCNGLIDEDAIFINYFSDLDGDDFGNILNDSLSCFELAGYVIDSTDCDDTNPSIYPGAPEILNGLDDNCDGLIDEGLEINNQLLSAIKIYPNPATDQLFIETSLQENFEIEIFDARGKIVFNSIINSSSNISLINYSSGIYFIKIISKNSIAGINFVKE